MASKRLIVEEVDVSEVAVFEVVDCWTEVDVVDVHEEIELLKPLPSKVWEEENKEDEELTSEWSDCFVDDADEGRKEAEVNCDLSVDSDVDKIEPLVPTNVVVFLLLALAVP